jgi:addiction module RelB/DinJ family antitoxin
MSSGLERSCIFAFSFDGSNTITYICSMTEVFQCRIDKKLVARAREVTKEIGTTPGEVVRLMFAQMVKRRAIPFPLNAESPEDEVLGPAERRAAIWDEL